MLELAVTLVVRFGLVALASYALIRVVRRLGPIARLVAKGAKPWACDDCMPVWATTFVWVVMLAVIHVFDDSDGWAVIGWGAAVGAVMMLLTWTAAKIPADPGAPEPIIELKPCGCGDPSPHMHADGEITREVPRPPPLPPPPSDASER